MLPLSRSQTHFALQAIVERRAAVAKRIAVLLRWHSEGGEVRRGPVEIKDGETRRACVDVLVIAGKKLMFWLLAYCSQ
jgi:hypothetical protein